MNPLEAAVVAARSHGVRVDEPQFVEDARARIERDLAYDPVLLHGDVEWLRRNAP